MTFFFYPFVFVWSSSLSSSRSDAFLVTRIKNSKKNLPLGFRRKLCTCQSLSELFKLVYDANRRRLRRLIFQQNDNTHVPGLLLPSSWRLLFSSCFKFPNFFIAFSSSFALYPCEGRNAQCSSANRPNYVFLYVFFSSSFSQWPPFRFLIANREPSSFVIYTALVAYILCRCWILDSKRVSKFFLIRVIVPTHFDACYTKTRKTAA